MKCKAVISEIEELEHGTPASVEVGAHLLVCESCRAFAEERAALRMLVGTLDKVSAPPDFDWRLKARLAEARSEREDSRRFLTRFAPGAQAIALAACVTLLLVAIVVYRQTRPASSNEIQAGAIAGADTKARASIENENKGLPVVNPQASALASVPDGKQPAASSETPRTRAIKSAKANTARTEASREPASRERIFSNDLASRGAEDVRSEKQGNASTGAAPVISVRLPSATSAQLRFEDGQGTRRTLSPINFGGQEFIERPDKARLVPASEKGIW